MAIRHFLSLRDLSPAELAQVIELAIEMKAAKREGRQEPFFKGKVLGMIFEKSSTRTRVRFAAYSNVPVINALTDEYHPCQLLADVQTFIEHRGPIKGKTVAWIGDGNNMCSSWINAAIQFDFKLQIATPVGYEANAELVAEAGSRLSISNDPILAASGADLVSTDVFSSMGQEAEQEERLKNFAGFRVDHALMAHATDKVLFMHCLPAHRGEEVSDELMEDEKISVVWDEAENRLHAQKALMVFLLQINS
jgi:ornithine carbamoyltransferase